MLGVVTKSQNLFKFDNNLAPLKTIIYLVAVIKIAYDAMFCMQTQYRMNGTMEIQTTCIFTKFCRETFLKKYQNLKTHRKAT